MKAAWLWWSSGKDSAWALHALRQRGDVQVTRLVSTVSQPFDRVAMHGVRSELLRRQARAAGVPLCVSEIPYPCDNARYEATFATLVEEARAEGITYMVFGDLFLEDVRHYRERQFEGTGVEPLFPLWGLDTRALAHAMVAAGVRAYLTCIDPRALAREFAGRVFDETLLRDLPASVDPCGENGELHTFVYAGPMLDAPIEVELGEVVARDGFVFADLLPCPSTT